LAIGGVVAALAAVEAAYRIAAPYLAASGNERRDRPLFFYYRRPADVRPEQAFYLPKSADTFRISVIGDSFTFGMRMQFDDTFSGRLERMLNLTPRSPKVEVVNCGVPGNATIQELPIVKRSIEAGADLVLLEITLNDPKWITFGAESPELHARMGPYRPPEELETLFHYWSSLGYLAARIHNTRAERIFRGFYFEMFENPKYWNPFAAAIKEMRDFAAAKGVRFAAVVFPLFDTPLDRRYPFKPLHEKTDALLKSLDIPFLDLLGTFRNMAHERLEVIPGVDTHPNEIAHRLAAERIYLWLMKTKLLPRELRIAHRNIEQEQPRPDR
jgi:lysophospholipase L1-like esterase